MRRYGQSLLKRDIDRVTQETENKPRVSKITDSSDNENTGWGAPNTGGGLGLFRNFNKNNTDGIENPMAVAMELSEWTHTDHTQRMTH